MSRNGSGLAGSPDGATYAAFAGAIVIGGTNFIAVSMSNMELPPLYGATVRFALASAVFFLIAAATRVPLVTGRSAGGPVLYGVLAFGATYALLYYALVGLPAGTAAVIVAAAPLFTLLIAVVLGQERLTLRGVVGGTLAIAGILILSLGTIEGEIGRSYLLAGVLGTFAMALSSVVAKACAGVHPVNMNAIGMAAGTLVLAVGSLALGEPWALPREPRSWWAVAWLVLLGSVGLFQLFLYVIRRWTASATVYAVAAMPVVASGLGVVMLDQPITMEVVLGGLMVMAAVYVGAIAGKKRPGAVAVPSRQ